MDRIQALSQVLAAGIDLVADAHRADLSALPAPTARSLRSLAQTYFEGCAFTRRQREAIAGARRVGHDLPTLELIERYARRAKTQAIAWRLRAKLCNTAADAPAMAKLARTTLRQLQPPEQKKEGVRLRRSQDGMWTMAITAPSSVVAELHNNVSSVADARRLFRHGATTSRVTTNVVLNLSELTAVIQGGNETILRMTNGATITGAELVRRTLSSHGLVTLVHPEHGPVNLYRTERLASPKQRAMAAVMDPVCPWPRCTKPADECQVHHLTSWLAGGETNASNLTMACAYHNAVNDDTGPPRNGRLAREGGKVTWLPPWATAR